MPMQHNGHTGDNERGKYISEENRSWGGIGYSLIRVPLATSLRRDVVREVDGMNVNAEEEITDKTE